MAHGPLVVKLAGNKDRHKISDEFKFGPVRLGLFAMDLFALERSH